MKLDNISIVMIGTTHPGNIGAAADVNFGPGLACSFCNAVKVIDRERSEINQNQEQAKFAAQEFFLWQTQRDNNRNKPHRHQPNARAHQVLGSNQPAADKI